MSIVGEVESLALSAVPGAGWVRIALKAAPWIAIAALLVALLLTRATLDRVKLQAQLDVSHGETREAKAEAANEHKLATAADGYAQRTAAIQPLIVHSKDTVTTYAQTPAGRATCLGAERVRGIDELDATLFHPAPAGGGAAAVPADAGAPAAGRDGQ